MSDTQRPYVTDWHGQLELTRCLPDGVSTGARLIYTLIVGHMRESSTSYPGYATLARESGLTEKTVWRCVRELRVKRLIDVTPGGGRDSNIYALIDFRVIHTLRVDADPTLRVDAEGPSASARSTLRVDATRPSASARTEEVLIEEEKEERACACGNTCPPGKWRCTDCQDHVDTNDAALAVMLQWRAAPGPLPPDN